MPGQHSRVAEASETQPHGDLSAVLDKRRQEHRHLRGSVAVISIEEHDHIRGLRVRQSGQTRAPVASARLLDDLCPHLSGDIRCPVRRITIDNYDLRDKTGGRSASTRPMAGASLRVGMTTDTRTQIRSSPPRTRRAPPGQKRVDAPSPTGPSHRKSERYEHWNQEFPDP